MKKTAAALLSALVFAAGCATSRVDADPRVVVDSSVPSSIRVLAVDYGETKGDNPVVSVSVRNTGSLTRRLQYRTVWFDPNGNPIDSVLSIWKSATLDSGEIADFRAVSPRADADGFRFEIRKAR